MTSAQRRVRFTMALVMSALVSITPLADAAPVPRRIRNLPPLRGNPVSADDNAISLLLSHMRPKGRQTVLPDTPLQIFPTVRLGLDVNDGKKHTTKQKPAQKPATPLAQASSSGKTGDNAKSSSRALHLVPTDRSDDATASGGVGNAVPMDVKSQDAPTGTQLPLTNASRSTSHIQAPVTPQSNETSPTPLNKHTNTNDTRPASAPIPTNTSPATTKGAGANTQDATTHMDDSGKAEDSSREDAEVSEAETEEEPDGDTFDEDDDFPGTVAISGIFSQEGSKHMRFMKGGVIELIEWLFVFILVAPGTFPAIGCMLYTCTNVARRRISSTSSANGSLTDNDNQIPVSNSRAFRPQVSAELQRRASTNADNRGIASRGRLRSMSDEMEES